MHTGEGRVAWRLVELMAKEVVMDGIVYGGERLFASGPARLGESATRWRHARQAVAGGERLVGGGNEGQELRQSGMLVGDSMEALREQMERIAGRVDGVGRELVNERGERREGVVMLGFEPGAVERLGWRWKVDYVVVYGLS